MVPYNSTCVIRSGVCMSRSLVESRQAEDQTIHTNKNFASYVLFKTLYISSSRPPSFLSEPLPPCNTTPALHSGNNFCCLNCRCCVAPLDSVSDCKVDAHYLLIMPMYTSSTNEPLAQPSLDSYNNCANTAHPILLCCTPTHVDGRRLEAGKSVIGIHLILSFIESSFNSFTLHTAMPPKAKRSKASTKKKPNVNFGANGRKRKGSSESPDDSTAGTSSQKKRARTDTSTSTGSTAAGGGASANASASGGGAAGTSASGTSGTGSAAGTGTNATADGTGKTPAEKRVRKTWGIRPKEVKDNVKATQASLFFVPFLGSVTKRKCSAHFSA
jgi:hypothetical protein